MKKGAIWGIAITLLVIIVGVGLALRQSPAVGWSVMAGIQLALGALIAVSALTNLEAQWWPAASVPGSTTTPGGVRLRRAGLVLLGVSFILQGAAGFLRQASTALYIAAVVAGALALLALFAHALLPTIRRRMAPPPDPEAEAAEIVRRAAELPDRKDS